MPPPAGPLRPTETNDPNELLHHAFYATLPPSRYLVLTSVAPYMTGADADDRFEFGLNAIIAGFEAASAAETAGDQQPG
jgi:Tetracyclin repressor-like, C-terminal domain